MSFEVVNSTLTSGAVFREDGTQLHGLDAELELKKQDKRDRNFERQILEWLENVVGEKCADVNDVHKSLKNGVLLCKLINVIEPGSIKRIDNRDIALVCVENLNTYLKHCWKLGVPSSDLFVTSDLYQARDLGQVVQNLWSLCRLAQSKPDWKGPKLGKSASALAAPAKKWASVDTQPKFLSHEETKSRLESQQFVDCPNCSKQIPRGSKFCAFCGKKPDWSATSSSSSSSNAETTKLISKLQDEIESLRKQLQDKENSFVIQIRQKEESVLKQLREKEEQLTKQLKENNNSLKKEQALESLQQRYSSQSKHLEKLETQSQDQEKEIEKYQSRLKKVVQQIDDLEAENESLTDKLESSQKQLKQIKIQHQEEQEKSKQNNNNNINSNNDEELKSKAKKIEKLEEEIENLQSELSRVERQLERERKQFDSTIQEIKDQNQKSLSSLKSQHQEQISALEQQISDQKRQKSNNSSELEELKQENESLQESNSRLRTQIDQFSSQINQLLKENQQFEQSKNANPEIKKLQKELQIQQLLKQVVEKKAQELEEKLEIERKHNMESQSLYNYATLKRNDSNLEPSNSSAITTSEFLDPSQFPFVREQMENMLKNKKFEEKNLDRLLNILRSEVGRRQLVKAVRKIMKKTPSVSLGRDVFGGAVEIVRELVKGMESGSADMITARKTLLFSSNIVSTQQGKLSDFLKDFSLFKQIKFWEDFFLDELFVKYRQHFPQASKVDPDFFATLCCSFGMKMIDWEVDVKRVREFLKEMVFSTTIAVENSDEVHSKVSQFLNSFSSTSSHGHRELTRKKSVRLGKEKMVAEELHTVRYLKSHSLSQFQNAFPNIKLTIKPTRNGNFLHFHMMNVSPVTPNSHSRRSKRISLNLNNETHPKNSNPFEDDDEDQTTKSSKSPLSNSDPKTTNENQGAKIERTDSNGSRNERSESVGSRSERSESIGNRNDRSESVGSKEDSNQMTRDRAGSMAETWTKKDIERECLNGLIIKQLHNYSELSVIAYFNSPENSEKPIDWSTVSVYERLDGVFLCLYWTGYEWSVASRFSPDASEGINKAPDSLTTSSGSTSSSPSVLTLEALFWEIWQKKKYKFPLNSDRNLCFFFELLSNRTRKIVSHDEERLILVGARDLTFDSHYQPISLEALRPFYKWEMVNRIEISGEEEAWEKVESVNPLRCAGFVCIDADFNQFQMLSSKFMLLKNSRTLQTTQQKALYVLELLVDVPDAIRLYPFQEDIPLMKWMNSRLEVLFKSVDNAYNDLKKIRNNKPALQAEFKKLDPSVAELLNLIIESKSFVTCQDLLQFDRNNRLKIREILIRWHQSTQAQNSFDQFNSSSTHAGRTSIQIQRTYTK